MEQIRKTSAQQFANTERPGTYISRQIPQPSALLLFDAQAAQLKQVKVAGQIVHVMKSKIILLSALTGC